MRKIPVLCLLCVLLGGTAFAADSSATDASVYLSMDETLARLGAHLRWDPFLKTGTVTKAEHYATFQAGARGEQTVVLYDGQDLIRTGAPFVEQGNLCFPEAFVSSLDQAFNYSIQDDSSRFRIAAIIVDPGHGGKDPGAVATVTVGGKEVTLVEKDITLKVSKYLYTRLQAAYPDKRILLTRSGDTYPTLEERTAMANAVDLKDNEAIIFISIHANYAFAKSARGYEVWYLKPETRRTVIDPDKYEDSAVYSIINTMTEEEYTTESIMIASSIVEQLTATVGKDTPSRGIKAEDWFVVKNSRMPAVLVELGFISNEGDAALLNDDEYLKKFSEAIYKGIANFVSTFERSGGFIAFQ